MNPFTLYTIQSRFVLATFALWLTLCVDGFLAVVGDWT